MNALYYHSGHYLLLLFDSGHSIYCKIDGMQLSVLKVRHFKDD